MPDSAANWFWGFWAEISPDQVAMDAHREPAGHPGVLVIPPPFADITDRDGLWDGLNSQLGTLFGLYEEEEVEPKLLGDMVRYLKEFADGYMKSNINRTVTIAWQVAPTKRPIRASAPNRELVMNLRKLTDFLEDAASRGKTVIIGMV